jgi:hypothetical protein
MPKVQFAGYKVQGFNLKVKIFTVHHAPCIMQPATINCDNYHFCLTINKELFGNFESVIEKSLNTCKL